MEIILICLFFALYMQLILGLPDAWDVYKKTHNKRLTFRAYKDVYIMDDYCFYQKWSKILKEHSS